MYRTLKKQFAVAIDHDIITRNQLFNLQSSNVVEPEICVNDTNSDGSVTADDELLDELIDEFSDNDWLIKDVWKGLSHLVNFFLHLMGAAE